MAEPKRVRVIGPKGSGTVPEDQLDQAMRNGYFPAQEDLPKEKDQPGWVERTWNRFNDGLVSPNAWLNWASIPSQMMGTMKTPLTIEQLEKERDKPPNLKETPFQAFSRTFHSGFTADLARQASSLTSPASISTIGLSQATKSAGAIGKVAKSLLASQGLYYGGKGALDVADVAMDPKQSFLSPEGSQKSLSGLAQVTGAAPAVAQVGRVTGAGLARIMPGVFAREFRAFAGALRSPLKEMPALRDAYDDVRGDLQQAKPKDFEELRDFSEKGRRRIAAETAGEILKKSPTGGSIDARDVGDRVRGQVTPWMKLRSTPISTNPEQKVIEMEARNIEQNLKDNPLNLVQAEAVVQDINAELSKFRKMSQEAQYRILHTDPTISIMAAVKESLQDQIEKHVNNYSEMKRRYGSYKEIQNQTERRMNDIDRQSGQMDWTQRKGIESAGSALGAIFSGQFLSGFRDILAGRVAGDIAIESLRRPERMLERSTRPAPANPFLGLGRSANFPRGVVQPAAEKSDDDPLGIFNIAGPQ